jgi:aspartate ammonia-lyase
MSREEVTRLLSPARLSGLEAITTSIPIVEAEAIERAEKSRE